MHFLVRLCSSVGGLVATSTIVCGLVKEFVSLFCCASSGSTPSKSIGDNVNTTTGTLVNAPIPILSKGKLQPPEPSDIKGS